MTALLSEAFDDRQEQMTGLPRNSGMRCMLLFLALACVSLAQPRSFEVASVKPNHSGQAANPSGRGGSMRVTPGQLVAENCSLWKLIGTAFGIGSDKDYAISGPDWLKSERFDVIAKVPPGAQPAMLMEMMQSLLAERFRLATHKEQRELPQYALVPARNGPKLKEVEDGATSFQMGPGAIRAQKVSMSAFADRLSQFLDRPVVDATLLKGAYDFTLEWQPDAAPSLAGETPSAAPGPSIFTAIQEQLGLRLEGRKGMVDVLVVDHAERVPSGN